MPPLSRQDLAIDLGTANTLVVARGRGVVVAEPSLVAVEGRDRSPVAVGEAARRLLGRTPASVTVVEPLREGVVHDVEATELLLRRLLRRRPARSLRRPDVIVCAPLAVTAVERRAVEEAALRAGARLAVVMEEPLAAAIGAGLPVAEPTGSLVVDLGAGTTEVAVISLGGVVVCEAVRIGGRHLDDAIAEHLRAAHGLAVGPATAQELKLEIGSALPAPCGTAEVRGRDLASGLPRVALVEAEEVARAIRPPLSRMLDAVRRSLERTPPELLADVMDRGVMLTGGGARLRGLAERLRSELQVAVHVPADPLACVARGAGMALEEMAVLRRGARRRR